MNDKLVALLLLLEFCLWFMILVYALYFTLFYSSLLTSLDILEQLIPKFIERNQEIKELMPSPFK